MELLEGWLGNVNNIPGLRREIAGLICLLVSAACGAIIGLERERREKAAGLRTLILICLGSTIYTVVSLLLASQKEFADPARLAAQILPGIGFLGAGAIIQSRGTVVGLTTGATIWTAAAVGVTIGAGYIAAGLAFTLLILGVLTAAQKLSWIVAGRCKERRAMVVYHHGGGKVWPRIQEILDRYHVHDDDLVHRQPSDTDRSVEVQVCFSHRYHRSVLYELAEIDDVVELKVG